MKNGDDGKICFLWGAFVGVITALPSIAAIIVFVAMEEM